MTRYIDTHTEGEPTRVVIDGAPNLGAQSLLNQLQLLSKSYDDYRRFVVNEPRGSDALVGAILCKSPHKQCVAGVIFFNNVGYLSMCGHGIMGVAAALYYQGSIQHGLHVFDTPAGLVTVELQPEHLVVVRNVPSYVHQLDVSVHVDGWGEVRGDIAWGGNWFFLVDKSPLPLTSRNIHQLSLAADSVRKALLKKGITGREGAEIDHIEFFGPATVPGAHSKNFVLCPGGAYDRSPCGTGTSAKLASLAARGLLRAGEEWIQESIIGSSFRASYEIDRHEQISPTIKGRAFVCSEGRLIREKHDPYHNGICETSVANTIAANIIDDYPDVEQVSLN